VSRPWLSVVIPTYNGAAYIKYALDSILAQQDAGCEVIVVDDGSTDNTSAIVAAYSQLLTIVYVPRTHCGNWIANTNYGMGLAKGEYTCWLHQDDMWSDGRLAILKRIIAAWPDVDMVLHPSWFVDASGKRVGLLQCPLPIRQVPLTVEELIPPLLIQNFIVPCAPLFRTSAGVRVGVCDESLTYVGDWDLWLRFASSGRTFYYPAPLSSVRLHEHSQTMALSAKLPDFRRQYGTVLERHLTRWERAKAGRQCVARAARFSAEINIALAGVAHGKRRELGRVILQALTLTPAGWYHFLRNSRIVERTRARLRAGVIRSKCNRAETKR
jgi:glycosyltransferase involved in cell wall biosynthesis